MPPPRRPRRRLPPLKPAAGAAGDMTSPILLQANTAADSRPIADSAATSEMMPLNHRRVNFQRLRRFDSCASLRHRLTSGVRRFLAAFSMPAPMPLISRLYDGCR